MDKIYILGSGAMANSMAKGLENSGFKVVLVSRGKLENSSYENELYNEIYDITDKNVILAFKPYALSEVAPKLKGTAKCVLSVLARTDLDTIKNALNAHKYAICMPNLAASHNASITPFMGDLELENIINGFGSSVFVSSKTEFDAAGVISGCAPAFLALVAEALANGVVLGGVKAKDANKLVSGVFLGTAKLLEDLHPAIFKERVCSPAGTTIEGVAKLEEMGIRSAFIQAVKASIDKQKG